MLRTAFTWGLAGLLAVLIVSWGAIPLGSLDLYWQVRTGAMALEAGRFPLVDGFSYVLEGARWNNHEWLYELGVAALQHWLGWGWFRFQALLLPALVLVALGWRARRWAGAPVGLLVASSAFLLFSAKFLPLPQTLSMALFFLAAELFLRGRWLRSAGWRIALAAFMLVWGNLTAEALLFLPFLLLVQGGAIWRRRKKLSQGELARASGWLLAACLLPMVNPPWASSFDYLLHGTGVNVALNAEFTSIFAPAATVSPLVKWFARVLCVGAVVWCVKRFKRGVLPVILAVIGACMFERNLWLLAFALASVVASMRHALSRPRAQGLALAATALMLGAFVLDTRWVSFIGKPMLTARWWSEHIDARFVPVACAEQLKSDRKLKVFTTRLWASWVLWQAPNAQIFVDGRNREYPPWATRAAEEIAAGGPATKWMLEESGTEIVLLPPDWSGPEPWHRVFAAPGCAVFSR